MAASHEKLDQALKGYSVVADKEHKRSRSAAETRCAALRLVAGWVLLCFVFVGYVVVVGVGFVGLLVLVVVVVVVVVVDDVDVDVDVVVVVAAAVVVYCGG